MTHIRTHRKAPPSPWAVGLFLISSGFAAVSLFLMTSGYVPS